MDKNNFIFELAFSVRDYECDLQGIVNNAVYQNYLEHTRHQFLKHINMDFATLHSEGFDAVVYRAEVDYISSLKSGDDFTVKLNVKKEGRIRFIFEQEIYKQDSSFGGSFNSHQKLEIVISRPADIPHFEEVGGLNARESDKKYENKLVLKALVFVAFSTNGKPVKAPAQFLQAIESCT